MTDVDNDLRRSLSEFSGRGYDKGRPLAVQVAWMAVQGVLQQWWVPAAMRAAVLRRFGAELGPGVLIRHRVRIHWPWKLRVGKNSWIGEGAWLLNLEPIEIGEESVVSQDVFLCTGSHDRHSRTFEFDNAPIVIGDGAWVAARATVLRGVRIGDGATVGATALVTTDVPNGAVMLAPRARSGVS